MTGGNGAKMEPVFLGLEKSRKNTVVKLNLRGFFLLLSLVNFNIKRSEFGTTSKFNRQRRLWSFVFFNGLDGGCEIHLRHLLLVCGLNVVNLDWCCCKSRLCRLGSCTWSGSSFLLGFQFRKTWKTKPKMRYFFENESRSVYENHPKCLNIVTCLVTLFDRKFQFFQNLPNWPFLGFSNNVRSQLIFS